MADRMVQIQKRCIIKKPHFEKALQSLRAVCNVGEMPVEDLPGKHFSFVEPEEIMQAKNFEQALSAIRFSPVSDAEGNICELHFTGEKQGDEHIFLRHLLWKRDPVCRLYWRKASLWNGRLMGMTLSIVRGKRNE